MKIINLIRVVFQTADLSGFVGTTLTDFYKSEVCGTLSCAYLDNPAIGQLEIGDDGSLCGSVLVQLPKIGNLPNFAIYRILLCKRSAALNHFLKMAIQENHQYHYIAKKTRDTSIF